MIITIEASFQITLSETKDTIVSELLNEQAVEALKQIKGVISIKTPVIWEVSN